MSTVTIPLRLPKRTILALRRIARHRHRTVDQIVELAMRAHVRRVRKAAQP